MDIASDLEDAAKGCVYGAFIGDAAGAILEFCCGTITEKIVAKAMEFPGGGTFRVGKGQVTDDSELAMCLAHALAECGDTLDVDIMAKHYKSWI
jgi:ADP-ribosyl-[dinitrogen reductase] hydrolase